LKRSGNRYRTLNKNPDLKKADLKKYGEQLLLNLGFGNTVVAEKVVAILSPSSSPMKRIKDEAKKDRYMLDVTHGRKTRAILITNSNHVILSAIQAETLSHRYEALMNPPVTREEE
jgi:regulator of extracellular matrix RemA (YlzA/DUF370 family)